MCFPQCMGGTSQSHKWRHTRCNFLPHLHHLLSAVFILPLPLQHFFLLCYDLRRVTKTGCDAHLTYRQRIWLVQYTERVLYAYLIPCDSQRVVQFSGQVGALPFNVAGGGPGVKWVLGHSTLHWRTRISVLLPGAKGEVGEERKHNQSQTRPSQRWDNLTGGARRILESNRKAASNYIKLQNAAKINM